jgi:hypothetical protein
MSLYDDDAQQGRRGVLGLTEAVKVVKKKIDEKQKFEKFAEKYGANAGINDFKVPGTSYSSFKDLI